MGRFYRTSALNFKDTTYRDPLELMMKGISVDTQYRDKAVQSADAYEQTLQSIKHLSLPSEKELLDDEIYNYNEKIDELSNLAYNSTDYRKINNGIRTLKKDIQSNMTTGNLSYIMARKNLFDQWEKDNAEAAKKDPGTYNLMRSSYLNSINEGVREDPYYLPQFENVIETPDFSKIFFDNIKKLMPDVNVTMKGGRIITNKSLSPSRLSNLITSITNDPHYQQWALQQAKLGRQGLLQQDEVGNVGYVSPTALMNAETGELISREDYNKLPNTEKAKITQTINPYWGLSGLARDLVGATAYNQLDIKTDSAFWNGARLSLDKEKFEYKKEKDKLDDEFRRQKAAEDRALKIEQINSRREEYDLPPIPGGISTQNINSTGTNAPQNTPLNNTTNATGGKMSPNANRVNNQTPSATNNSSSNGSGNAIDNAPLLSVANSVRQRTPLSLTEAGAQTDDPIANRAAQLTMDAYKRYGDTLVRNLNSVQGADKNAIAEMSTVLGHLNFENNQFNFSNLNKRPEIIEYNNKVKEEVFKKVMEEFGNEIVTIVGDKSYNQYRLKEFNSNTIKNTIIESNNSKLKEQLNYLHNLYRNSMNFDYSSIAKKYNLPLVINNAVLKDFSNDLTNRYNIYNNGDVNEPVYTITDDKLKSSIASMFDNNLSESSLYIINEKNGRELISKEDELHNHYNAANIQSISLGTGSADVIANITFKDGTRGVIQTGNQGFNRFRDSIIKNINETQDEKYKDAYKQILSNVDVGFYKRQYPVLNFVANEDFTKDNPSNAGFPTYMRNSDTSYTINYKKNKNGGIIVYSTTKTFGENAVNGEEIELTKEDLEKLDELNYDRNTVILRAVLNYEASLNNN